jgi:hypothetical protein
VLEGFDTTTECNDSELPRTHHHPYHIRSHPVHPSHTQLPVQPTVGPNRMQWGRYAKLSQPSEALPLHFGRIQQSATTSTGSANSGARGRHDKAKLVTASPTNKDVVNPNSTSRSQPPNAQPIPVPYREAWRISSASETTTRGHPDPIRYSPRTTEVPQPHPFLPQLRCQGG